MSSNSVDRDGAYPDLRDKVTRRLVFAIITALILGIPLVVLSIIGAAVNVPWIFVLALSILIAGEIYAKILPRRLLNITPEAQALITQNPFGGGLVVYGPGVTIPFPWEGKTIKSNYSLQVINRSFAVAVPTITGLANIVGNFQYSAVLDKVEKIVRADDTQIDEGFTGYIEAFLTDYLTELTLEKARGQIQDLNKELRTKFMELRVEDGDNNALTGAQFLDAFGIKAFVIQIRSIKLPDAVQKTQDAIAEAEGNFKVVATIYGTEVEVLKKKLQDGSISREDFQKMLEYAFAASENAEMKINVYRGDVLQGLSDTARQFFGSKKA